jgi:hypothetical protein
MIDSGYSAFLRRDLRTGLACAFAPEAAVDAFFRVVAGRRFGLAVSSGSGISPVAVG